MQQRVKKIVTHKYFLIFTAALLLYTLLGFVALPLAMRWYLPKFAEENLHSKASIETVRFNPFLFTLDLKNFRLEDTNEELLVGFNRLHIDLDPSVSLIRLALVLRTIELDQPDIQLVLDKNGVSNFERLVPPADPDEPDSADASSLFPFILQNARMHEGQLTVIDQRQSTPARLVLHNMTFEVKELSSLKERQGQYGWTMAVKDTGSLQGGGTISLTPFRTVGNVEIKDLPFFSLWQFLRDSTNLEEPSGQLDFSTQYAVGLENDTDQLLLTETQLSLADTALRLHQKKTDLFTLKKCQIDAPVIDLVTRKIQIAQILLEDGTVDGRINESGVVNFEQILREATTQTATSSAVQPAQAPITNDTTEKQPAEAPSTPQADTPFMVAIEAVAITNIAVQMEDLSHKSPLHARVTELNLHLQANIEAAAAKTAVLVQKIGTELKGISLGTAPSEPPLFAAEQIVAENGGFDLIGQSITIDRITVARGRLDAGLDPQGALNWQTMLEPKNTTAVRSPGESAPAQEESAWKFLVKTFEINDFSSQFTDQTTGSKKPVQSLKNIQIRCTNIDGQSPMGISIGARIEQGGSLSIKGTINPSIPSVDAEIQADSLNLVSLQPYLAQQANLLLQSAAISTKGRLYYGIPGKKYATAYEGSFSFNDLLLTHADNPKKPYFSWKAVQIPQFRLTLEPNRFEAREIILVQPMTEMIIEEDATLNLAKVIKEAPPAKTTSKAKKTPEKTTAKKQKQEDFAFQISKIGIEQGNMVFADLSLRPQFMTRIHDLKGTITGLSSAENAQADVQINGMVDRFGTAKISGRINTSDVPRDSKIDVDFRNVEMKNLSPYSGRFAGRLIKSGKVSANLKYTFHDHKMIGDNKIIIDKLALGDRVDTPDSSSLPLDLAIAILQDSNGRIDIGLPISGNLNDPEFSFGSIVWKAFSGLITKLATSPFRMIGGLLGGDEEDNDAIMFAQGQTALPPPEKEKLLKLAEALQDRPQLKLVLQGQYNAKADGNELQQDSIRTEVFRKLGFKPEPDTLSSPLNFSDSSTQDALEELYTERFGKKALEELEQNIAAGTVTPRMPTTPEPVRLSEPGFFCKIIESIQIRNILPGGMSQEEATLWSGELYTQLSENEKVTETRLLQLADKRAQAVAELLEREGQIAADRLQTLTADPLRKDEPPSVVLSLDAM